MSGQGQGSYVRFAPFGESRNGPRQINPVHDHIGRSRHGSIKEDVELESGRTRSTARWLAIAVTAMSTGASIATAKPAEISVLSASAMRSVMTDLTQAFRRETGHSVTLGFATAGAIEKRILAGDPADVVITTDAAMERIAGQGLVIRATSTIVARTGLGIGVREGARKPDISSVNKFKQTLLAAKSITYPDPARGGASGIHFARVIERLGIAQTVKEKTVLGASPEAVCEAVAKGEVELCVHQISEILPVRGVTFVGPLPRDVQCVTTFAAAISGQSSSVEAAKAFLTFLSRPSFKAQFAKAALDYRVEVIAPLTDRKVNETQAPPIPISTDPPATFVPIPGRVSTDPPDRKSVAPFQPAPTREERAQAERLFNQGERHLVDGNISIARQYFLRAAELGLPIAALKLAETHDPSALVGLNVRGLVPDPVEARKWYERAIELGAPEAEARLQLLGRR
jgi:molybdate transport system substrate-binding protein